MVKKTQNFPFQIYQSIFFVLLVIKDERLTYTALVVASLKTYDFGHLKYFQKFPLQNLKMFNKTSYFVLLKTYFKFV